MSRLESLVHYLAIGPSPRDTVIFTLFYFIFTRSSAKVEALPYVSFTRSTQHLRQAPFLCSYPSSWFPKPKKLHHHRRLLKSTTLSLLPFYLRLRLAPNSVKYPVENSSKRDEEESNSLLICVPMAPAAISERVELARLCSSKDWSKAIRILDSLITQSSAIQDIWFVSHFSYIFLFKFLSESWSHRSSFFWLWLLNRVGH